MPKLHPLRDSLARCEEVYHALRSGQSSIEDLYSSLSTFLDELEQLRLEQPQNVPDLLFLGRYDVYETAAAVAYSLGRAADAFEYAERTRARWLLDRTLNKISLDQKRLDGGLLRKEASLKRRVQELTRRWHAAAILRGSTRDLGALPLSTVFEGAEGLAAYEAEAELREARAELKNVLDAIRQQDPAFAALRGVAPATVNDAKVLLDGDSALLAYCITEERVIVFVITPEGLWSEHVNIPRTQLSELVMRYRSRIELFAAQPRGTVLETQPQPDQRDLADEDAELDALARELFDILIRPVKMHLRGRSRLGVIPHGDLHLLPFQALRSERGYLIKDYSLWYAPSISLLDLCYQRQRRSRGRLLALGDPDLGNSRLRLPFAAQEVSDIALLFSTKAYVGPEASLAALKQQWEHADVLHLACHALFDTEQPEFSALLLAEGAEDTGRLEAQDLFALDHDLPLSQVTLSACQTSLGAGSDLTGLATGFLYAGAPAVVASLWRVDDFSTGELMVTFYRALMKSDRADALSEAQRQLLQSAEHAHPYFWAAFKLIGTPLAMESERTYSASAFNIMHRWTFRHERGALTSPAVSGGMLYAALSEHEGDGSALESAFWGNEVVGISLSDRQLLWRREVSARANPYCWLEGLVHVDATSKFYGLRAADGEVIWERETGTHFTQSCHYDGSSLYIGGHSRSVYALRPETGEVLWEHALPRPASGGFAVGEGSVFVGCNDHHLYALDAGDGRLLWRCDLGYGEWGGGVSWVSRNHLHTPKGTFGVESGERDAGARLSDDTKLVANERLLLDRVSQFPFNQDISFRQTFLLRADDFVFVVTAHSGPRVFLNVFDAEEGTLLRRYHLGESGITGMCREGELLVVGTGDGVMHGFSLEKALKERRRNDGVAG